MIFNFIKNIINQFGLNSSKFNIQNKKYLFYILTLVLPILNFFLIKEYKYYTIILISFLTFLQYFNLCLFQKLCLINSNSKEKCELTLKEIYEGCVVYLSSFLLLFLMKRLVNFLSKK